MASSSGMKTNIAVNMLFMMFFAMVLTAFVSLSIVERILIAERLGRGQALVLFFESYNNRLFEKNSSFELTGEKLSETFGVSEAVVILPETEKRLFLGKSKTHYDRLENLVEKAVLTGKIQKDHTGSGFGMFWLKPEGILYAAPIHMDNGITAGVGLNIQLTSLYSRVREAQKLVFIYILVNTLIMSLVGVYQIGKVTIRPLKRLLNRAETFTGDTGDFIFEEKAGNEFSKLSIALNAMLRRISAHKIELEKTVKSLEAANLELEKAQSKVIRAEKMSSVGRLSSGIAHEIGNPLGIVSGYLELLKTDDISYENKQEFIIRAEKELARIDRIIRQLLNYARSKPLPFTDVSVHEAIIEVAEMIRVQPLMAGIDFVLDLKAEKDRITGDSDHLRQIVMNLAINARDAITAAARQNGRIVIETANVSDYDFSTENITALSVIVRDNGTGIPQDFLKSIFDPFFTTKDPGKGTGLGLSVCDTMILDMDGRVEVKSEEGTGTEFSLFFPLIQEDRR